MRVCMLTTSYPRHSGDFAGVFIHTLARELANRGVAVDIVAPHAPDCPQEEVIAQVNVHRFTYMHPKTWQQLAYGHGIPANLRQKPWRAFLIPSFLLAFLKAAYRHCMQCDLVHVHWAPLAWIGMWIQHQYNIPLVVSVHGSDIRALPPMLTRPALKRAEAVIATSYEIESLLQNKLHIKNYHSISPPIDTTALRPGMSPGTATKEIDWQPGDFVITFVGRLNMFKDPLTLVRAAPRILAQYPRTHILIIGQGPLYGELQATISKLGVTHAVHMLGARRGIGPFLSLTHIFVALSPVENVWSMTITEAMHMQVPCILTRAGETPHVFTHLENTFLIEPSNSAQLANAVLQLLANDNLRQHIVQGANRLLQKHGKDTETIMEQTTAVYQAVIETYEAPHVRR